MGKTRKEAGKKGTGGERMIKRKGRGEGGGRDEGR